MTVEISMLIAIAGCFVGLAGWLSGRDKKISSDSEWKGEVNAKLDLAIGIRQDHEELRYRVTSQGKDIVALQHDLANVENELSTMKQYIYGGNTHEN